MKMRTLLIGLGATMLAATLGNARAEPTRSRGGAADARASGPAKQLEKGMTAEGIIALIGKPAEVRAMDVPEGKAEVWTYRRLLNEQVRQNAASVTMVPAFKGMNGDGPIIGDTPELNYHLEHVRDYQVTSLLMFDGKLVVGRQRIQREHTIDP